MYFLASISCPLLFPLSLQFFSTTPWFLEQYHLATLLVFLLSLNPIATNSDINYLFKVLYNEDNFHKLSSILKNRTLTALYWRNTTPFLRYINEAQLLLSFVWLVAALIFIYQCFYKPTFHLNEATLLGIDFNQATIYTITTFLLIFTTKLIYQISQGNYPQLDLAIKSLSTSLKRGLFTSKETKYNERQLLQNLKNLDLFKSLDIEDIKKIITAGKIINYKKHNQIIKQGELSTDLFVLLRGRLIVNDNSSHPLKILGYIQPFSVFGEAALAENKRRQAEVIATEDSLAFKIQAQSIKDVIYQSPSIKKDKNFKSSIIIDQFFHSSPIFRSLSENTVQQLKKRGKPVEYKEKTTIFKQGQIGDALYLIIRGSVGFYKNGHLVSKLDQGNFFGEISIMANIPQITSAKAHLNSLLLAIDNKDFWHIVSHNLELALLMELTGKARIQGISESSLV